MGLDANERINVEGLLYGMLVNSGADAACALSHHYNGNFIGLMNQKASDLGLLNTHFENETGLDGLNGNHYSTAEDLVRLSKVALENGVFRKIVGTRQANIPNATQSRWHGLTSTNKLLFTRPGTTGIKTGYTEKAKGCLAVSYEREGREIIGVILGSDDRFGDTETILDWVITAFQFPSKT
jgi:D-alanyl-D-alanine carboxypeptidase